jgi:probable rRNA maturation factor
MPVLFRCRLRRKIFREPCLTRLAQKILILSGDPEAELSLEIVGNTRIRRLNRHYRQEDRPTDVLAFPIREAVGPRTPLLGDVVISFPKAAKQASQHGHSIEEELVHLLIHGILHLKGFDHEKGVSEARRMHRMERALLNRLRPLPTFLKTMK